jgi:hypothetical protein
MGQYYFPVILADEPKKELDGEQKEEEQIQAYMYPFSYLNGCKLMEHSYIGSIFVSTFEYELSPQGRFHMSRVVWTGDSAENELNKDKNLYSMCDEKREGLLITPSVKDSTKFRYIVNNTNKQYVDKLKCHGEYSIHPLPLLTCEGNGRGGGDFFADDRGLVGAWARDVISVEEEIPDGYVEIIFDLVET